MSSAFRFRDIFVQGVQDPYPFYHWLRTEAPVYWNAEIVPAWFISRYDDAVAITEDDRRFGSRGGIASAVQQERDGCFWHTQAAGILFTDGVAHSRARGLLEQSFPPSTSHRCVDAFWNSQIPSSIGSRGPGRWKS